MRVAVLAAAIVGSMSGGAMPVSGQDYPQRPIRLLVGFTPGGSTDLVGRLVAAKLSERLGQPGVVGNRAGASGIIAAEVGSKSQPDGYTPLVAGSSISIVGSLYKETKVEMQRALEPLALFATP